MGSVRVEREYHKCSWLCAKGCGEDLGKTEISGSPGTDLRSECAKGLQKNELHVFGGLHSLKCYKLWETLGSIRICLCQEQH